MTEAAKPPAPARRRGRKPARESCAAEIRQRIARWKQTPEGKRQPPTLTELAAGLGISHQLASYYASRAPTMEEIEYQRQSEEYFGKARAIMDRADREGRVMTPAEQEEVLDCYRASGRAMLPVVWQAIERDVRKRGLSRVGLRRLRMFAQAGSEKAQALLHEFGGDH